MLHAPILTFASSDCQHCPCHDHHPLRRRAICIFVPSLVGLPPTQHPPYFACCPSLSLNPSPASGAGAASAWASSLTRYLRSSVQPSCRHPYLTNVRNLLPKRLAGAHHGTRHMTSPPCVSIIELSSRASNRVTPLFSCLSSSSLRCCRLALA